MPAVKVLSVRQPFAEMIVSGGAHPKRIENRTWRTTHRGRLFIHASRREPGAYPFLRETGQPHGWEPPRDCREGVIVGSVDVLECLPCDKLELLWMVENWHGGKPKHLPKATAAAMAEYPHLLPFVRGMPEWICDRDMLGPFCFVLGDPKPLKKLVPTKGKLGVWTFQMP